MIAAAVLAAPYVTCDNRVDYASRERCWGFGTHWSPERSYRLTGGFGMYSSSFSTAGRTFDGGPSRSRNGGFEPVRYDGAQTGLSALHTTSIEARFHGHLWNGLYLGGALGFGWGSARSGTVRTASMDLEDDPGVDLLHLRLGFVTGYRIPLRWLSVRLETMLGIDYLSLDHQGVTPSGLRPGVTSSNLTALVEPRVALDIWASPWTTLSFYAGKNVLRAHDHTLGFTLSGHLRPFDGEFRRW